VLKWLCGGPGVAYLYVRPDLGKKLEPKFTGWFAHENSFAFAIGPTRYSDPPFRFMNGTTQIASIEAAHPGIKIIREVGVEKIREKSKRMTRRLIELADRHGWRVNSPRDPEQRGGTVSIDMPDAQQISRALLAREILVDFRPKAGVRFSPHFYNTDAEVDGAIDAVAEILRSRAVTA
jgi:kynureninase